MPQTITRHILALLHPIRKSTEIYIITNTVLKKNIKVVKDSKRTFFKLFFQKTERMKKIAEMSSEFYIITALHSQLINHSCVQIKVLKCKNSFLAIILN